MGFAVKKLFLEVSPKEDDSGTQRGISTFFIAIVLVPEDHNFNRLSKEQLLYFNRLFHGLCIRKSIIRDKDNRVSISRGLQLLYQAHISSKDRLYCQWFLG